MPAAYTAAAIIEIDRFTFEMQDLVSRYKFLQKLFTDEFSFDEQISAQDQISKALKGFISEGILVPDPEYADTFNLTSEGLRKLKWFAAFLIPFFESYMTLPCIPGKKKKQTNMMSKSVQKSCSPLVPNYTNATRWYERNPCP